MNASGKLYQFYIALADIAGTESPVTQNCFEQLTEDAQMNLVNDVLASAFAL